MGASIKERVARSVFWIVWSRGGVQVLSGLSTILVARFWLEPSDYGLMALAGVWTTTMGMIAELGLGSAIIQFRDLEEDELNACFWLMAVIGFSGYFALFLCAPLIAEWFENPALASILRVSGLTLPLISLVVVPDGLLRKRLAFDKIAKIHLASALASLVTVLVMASGGAGVWALVAGGVISPLVSNIGMVWVVGWWPGVRLESRRLSNILHFSLSTLGSRFFWTVYNQVDVVVLGKLTNEATLGFYTYAKELAMIPVVRGSAVVNQLAFPVMAELQDDRQAMQASFMKGLRIVSCCFFPVCVGMALVASDAVLVLLTEKWLPIVPMLQVLCIYASFKSIDVLLPPVLLACYRHQFVFVYTVVLFVVMSMAFWLGASWNGGMGVVFAWLVAYPVIMSGLVREVLKEISMNMQTFWQQIRAAVTATCIMAVAVMGLQVYVLPSEISDSLLRLLVSAMAGASVYAAVLLGHGRRSVEELTEVFRWVFVMKNKPA